MDQTQAQEQTPKTGYIYTIKSHQTTDIYIGSTTKTINKRYSQHKSNYKKYLKDPLNFHFGCRSFEILKYNDHYIELLETVSYTDKKQLNIREGYYIVQNIENIVNNNIAGRTRREYERTFEYKQYMKEYHNTPEHKQYKKEYQKEYQKEYRKRKRALRNGTTSNTPEPEPQE